MDSAKKSVTDEIKTTEATGDLIGNKIADKITTTSKKSARKLSLNEANNEIPKKDISPQERQQIIDEIRLI